jgi:hypothetical protein
MQFAKGQLRSELRPHPKALHLKQGLCNQLNSDFCFDLSEFCRSNPAYLLEIIDAQE